MFMFVITGTLSVTSAAIAETYDKLKTCEDIILWSGYDCPEKFDPDLIKDNISKKSALEKGLRLCEENAEGGICGNQELLAIYYYSEKKDFK